MGTGRLLAFLAITTAIVVVESLKKEVINLPPLIHFTDVFNTESDKEQDRLIDISLGSTPGGRPPIYLLPNTGYPPPNSGYPPLNTGYQPPNTGWPTNSYPAPFYPPNWYPQPSYLWPPYTSQPGYPQPGYSQPGYPQPGFPQPGFPQHGYPRPGPRPSTYPQQQPYPQPGFPKSYPPLKPGIPPYPRQQDVELVERYWKFNDDGSKEYKLVLSNGLNIYQKVLNKNGDKQNLQLLEGYYSNKRDDNTYLTTYFRADEKGYDATSEITDSPPSFPNVKEMMSLPIPASHNKQKK